MDVYVPTKYIDECGREIFVASGLSGDMYGTFWRAPAGGLHRVVSPAMPMVRTRNTAQANLDKWAAKNKLEKVE
jgi:hypothetical protein